MRSELSIIPAEGIPESGYLRSIMRISGIIVDESQRDIPETGRIHRADCECFKSPVSIVAGGGRFLILYGSQRRKQSHNNKYNR